MNATFDNLNVTHLLVLCPRGFANERQVLPIPAPFVANAAKLVHYSNPCEFAAQTRLVPIEDAVASDRKQAGRQLIEWHQSDYMQFLAELFFEEEN